MVCFVHLENKMKALKADKNLAVVAAELANDTAGGNVPVKHLPIAATRHQLRVVSVQRKENK